MIAKESQITGKNEINSEAYVQIIPLMELQKEYIDFVEQTDKSKLAIQHSHDKLELLKKSLMQKYFG